MLTPILRHLSICFLMCLVSNVYADGIPGDCTQLILGIAPTWNSMRGELRLFERARGGDWVSVAGPFPVLFGKNGVAWGTGLAGQYEPGLRKKGTRRTGPCGAFRDRAGFWVRSEFASRSRLPVQPRNRSRRRER